MIVQVYKFTNNHWTIYLKWANFMLCNLCLNKVVKQYKDKIKQYQQK